MAWTALFHRDKVKEDTKQLRDLASEMVNRFGELINPRNKIEEGEDHFRKAYENMLQVFEKLLRDEMEHMLQRAKEERREHPEQWLRQLHDEVGELGKTFIDFGLWVEKAG